MQFSTWLQTQARSRFWMVYPHVFAYYWLLASITKIIYRTWLSMVKSCVFNHTYAAQTVTEKPKLQFVRMQLDHKDCPLLGSESKLPSRFCQVFQGKKKSSSLKVRCMCQLLTTAQNTKYLNIFRSILDSFCH